MEKLMANKTTDPLKGDEIARVRAVVESSPRDYALFVLGTNTAFRASDIVALNCGDVRYLKTGGRLRIREQKTGNLRDVAVNEYVVEALTRLLVALEPADDDTPLFQGHKRHTRITVSTFSRLVNDWCKQAGLVGEYSSHTLRKTFGYTMRTKHKVDVAVLQDLYGHSSGRTTLKYVGIQQEEKDAVYMLGVV